MNIEYIGAGAGSGKTYTVTKRIGEALLNKQCDPPGLIATTYTRKAANELRQRIRAQLYEAGRPDLAARMDEALIGTVHSVCARILQQHAFAAGISPQLDIMDENDASLVMHQMADLSAPRETTERLEELAELLGQRDSRTNSLHWPQQLRAVLSQVRANDFSPEELLTMADQTADGYLALGGPASDEDLDAELLATLNDAVGSLPATGDSTKTTNDTIREMERLRDQQEAGRLPWSAWIKLSRIRVGKKSEDLVVNLKAAAAAYPTHPRYHTDIREYISTIFGLATETLYRFQDHKRERGLVDYSDLEQMTYHLLRDREDVRSACSEEMQLLVVDEFQDTSPLQLALFLELAGCVDQTLWVGDVKQSIYGFRGSDPQLVEGVVERLRAENRLGAPLSHSWRSVPELVQLANDLFTRPFADSIGAQPEEVRLEPVRPHVARRHPPLEFLHARSGETTATGAPKLATKQTIIEAIAQHVATILANSPPHQVGIKGTEGGGEKLRDIQPGDIAVLCRVNGFAREVAQALTRRGIAVSLSAPGLLDTPEASLALACVRVLADRSDTLARAEVMSWQSGLPLEQILTERIAHVRVAEHPTTDEWALSGDSANEAIQALIAGHGRLSVDPPSAILDHALTSGRVWETASRWDSDPVRAGQRRANIEALRGLCRRYEETCHAGHLPATVGGFLGWCAQLNDDEADNQAADPSSDAVQVTTYHRAKGLEWPIVICAQLDASIRDEWQNVQTVPTGDRQVDFDAPLENRTLHFWPSPFDLKSKDFGHLETVRHSNPVQRIQARAENEALRLLYVGITRARDRLILVGGDKVQNRWLDSLSAEWLRPQDDIVQLPSGTTIPCREHLVSPDAPPIPKPAPTNMPWFSAAETGSEKTVACRIPSAEPPSAIARVVETIEYGERLPLTGSPDEAALGNAVHGFMAFDLKNPDRDDRSEVAGRLVANHGLAGKLTAEALIASADRFRAAIEDIFQPKRLLVEVPFHHQNAEAQSIAGFIDLLVETETGWVIIDHKSFPGRRSDWEAKALSYSGQLATYRDALPAQGTGTVETWVHLAVGGGLLKVVFDEHD